MPFFIPILGSLLAAGLIGGTVGLGAGAAVAYYYTRPVYYPMPAANYAPYPYQYAMPTRVCPHCGAPF